MSTEQIVELLNDNDKVKGDYVKLLEYLIEPRNGNQIYGAKLKNELFKILVPLKNINAISFENGKYFTTENGKIALKNFTG